MENPNRAGAFAKTGGLAGLGEQFEPIAVRQLAKAVLAEGCKETSVGSGRRGILFVYNMENPSGHSARGIRQSALENRHEQR
jgi:hypothetical protein